MRIPSLLFLTFLMTLSSTALAGTQRACEREINRAFTLSTDFPPHPRVERTDPVCVGQVNVTIEPERIARIANMDSATLRSAATTATTGYSRLVSMVAEQPDNHYWGFLLGSGACWAYPKTQGAESTGVVYISDPDDALGGPGALRMMLDRAVELRDAEATRTLVDGMTVIDSLSPGGNCAYARDGAYSSTLYALLMDGDTQAADRFMVDYAFVPTHASASLVAIVSGEDYETSDRDRKLVERVILRGEVAPLPARMLGDAWFSTLYRIILIAGMNMAESNEMVARLMGPLVDQLTGTRGRHDVEAEAVRGVVESLGQDPWKIVEGLDPEGLSTEAAKLERELAIAELEQPSEGRRISIAWLRALQFRALPANA